MSDFRNKIIRGESTSDEDWNQYLREAHRIAPSMTPAAFASYKTVDGQRSYDLLVRSIDLLGSQPHTILDLACGDGYMIPLLLPKLAPSGKVIGIDMSEGELNIARKNYLNHSQVQLHQAQAQSIPLKDSSIDAIVCHMAFMLMLPIEPVVSEIHRVLKSGGSFSAVIGNARGKPGFLGEIQKIVGQYLDRHYPKAREARSGDNRVQSEAGIQELFSSQHGFQGSVDILDFSLLIPTDPQEVWNLMKDMYFVSMLLPAEKNELEAEIKKHAAAKAKNDKQVNFEFQMRLFTVKKV